MRQVLGRFAKVSLVTWDTVLRLGQPWSAYDTWLKEHKKSAIVNFLEKIGHSSTAKERKSSDSKWLLCDPLAVAVAIDESIILESKARRCATSKPKEQTSV